MLESRLKADFKAEVKRRIPHVKMYEPKTHTRAAPDLIILGTGAIWWAGEFKKDRDSDEQPNQDSTINYLNDIGYADFVYPDNAEEVLRGLERLFEAY